MSKTSDKKILSNGQNNTNIHDHRAPRYLSRRYVGPSQEDKIRTNIKKCEVHLQHFKEVEHQEAEKIFPALQSITNCENSCYDSVGVLLGTYASLDRWEAMCKRGRCLLVEYTNHDMESLKRRKEQDIKEIENKISILDQRIEELNSESDGLINYACTTYAEMIVTIDEMVNFKRLLDNAFRWESGQLAGQKRSFQDKIRRRIKVAECTIPFSVRKEMYNLMSNDTLVMEQDNQALRVKIRICKKEIAQKKKAMKNLLKEIKVLENDPTIDTRKILFPHIFNKKADCTPDVEFQLDIPIKTYERI